MSQDKTTKPMILYVDDEKENLTSFKFMFRNRYRIHIAESAEIGLELIRKLLIKVVISDQRMPGTTGVQFLEMIADEFPESIRMILTGYSDMDVIIEGINKGKIFHYLMKPWQEDEVKLAIQHAFEIVDLREQNRSLVTNLQRSNKEISKYAADLETEIKERKMAAMSLKRSEERFQLAMKGSDDGLWDWDFDTNTIYFSPRFKSMLGHTEEEIGDGPDEFMSRLHHDDLQSARNTLRDFREGLSLTFEREVRFRHKDGRYLTVLVRAFGVRNSDGSVARMVGTHMDITRIKRTEEELQRRNAFLRMHHDVAKALNERDNLQEILSTAVNSVCVHTGWPVGHVYLVSEEDPDLLMPTTIWHLERPDEFDQLRKISEGMSFVRGEGLPGRVLDSAKPAWIVDVTKDTNFPRSKEAKAIGIRTGFAFPVSVEKRVLGVLEFFSRKAEAPDEVLLEIVGDVGVQLGRVIARKEAEHKLHEINEELEHRVESITADLKNANEALKDAGSDLMEARDAAQAASRAKRTFLANMSHEIRTPMNAILGFTQLMQCDKGLAPENLEKVRIISRSGEHLLELINDILEVSKIEAGRVALTTATFDLSEFLRDVELMFRIPVEEKKLRFTVRKSESLPQYVVTDEGKLRQVLINLLGNALKFTEEGKITLEVLSEQSPVNVNISMNFQQAPLSLRFEVKDTGRGFAEDEMDYLFRQFEQTKSGTRSQSGTGLGLAISKKYSVMLGGDLTVSSQVGKGSVFRVTIPIIEGQRKDVPERVIHRQISGLVKDQPEFRLLVVDDEQTNRMLLSSMLTMIGFNVREANDGRQAIAVWREWAPHLIFMDISMPVMDGKEATRRIKSMEAKQETVIIAVTASVLEQDREDILSAGVDDFLPKPFREQELFEMIQSALGVRYDYEEEEPASNIEAGEESDETVLTPESMASLDPDLLKQLRSATTAADMDLIDGLINQIEDQNPKLAKGLRDLADRFEYEKLENWII